MRSKRLLAMLLTFCLVLSCMAPTALAVEAPADSFINAEKSENASDATKPTVSPFENDRLVSNQDAQQGANSLRDRQDLELETVTRNDEDKVDWEITAGQKPEIGMLQNETPACLEELKEAAELYAADEVVRAIIVMEEAPLAQTFTSPLLVSDTLERQMIEKQDTVIASVERSVLQGQKLNVRYQFTYLANAISVETEFANLEKIARISGVKTVFIAPVYTPCETVSNPNTAASGAMTGVHTVWENLGYTGEGMKIAIIDTGLDLDHPSFEALDAEMVENNDNYLSVEDIDAVLEQLNAYDRRTTVQGKTLYRSTKVPYAFNYVDSSLTADHSADMQGDHGTHVAGIAAANKTEGTSVVGMAPDAQLIVMKVFGQGGGAYTDDIVAALEDAMILGCDVVNASLGSPAGFSESGNEFFDSVYASIANQNIIATISAGNEGTSSYDNMWGTDMNRTQHPDNATVGSPSLYANAFSIASAENSEVMTNCFQLADGTVVFYQDSIEGLYADAGYAEYAWAQPLSVLADVEFEYVLVPGLGSPEDVASVDVEGKIAVIKRGTLSFSEKVMNAENAGAVGVIIWNTNDTDDIFSFGMTTVADDYNPGIPSAIITLSDGQKMADAETMTMTVSSEQAPRVVEGGQMSSFSSWGVSPDLRLVPDITGIGGNVYSCYDGGNYGLMSGTSMSAPQIAGVSALIMQYLYDQYPAERAANDGYISDLARAILMSTSDPIISTDSGVEASPRQQGAGLVNAAEAVKTKAFLTVNGGRPKAELGDSKNGKYSFTFEINNFSQEAETYTLSSSLLTEDIVDYGIGEYFMAGYDVALTGDVSFSINNLAPASEGEAFSVTVPGGKTVEVTVTITLSDEDRAMFARYWENGGYVEGFVYLDNTDEYGVDLNLPFLGFYGDWTQAPVFDTAYWYDNSFWSIAPADGWPEGDEYFHVMWTDLAGSDWVLGINPYSGPYTDANGNLVYDPANNTLSPNDDGILDGFEEMYISLMRNADTLTFIYTDVATGEVLHRETVEHAGKTMYRSNYGQVVPWIYSWYGSGMYDFAGLANNTQVLLTIDGTVDYELGGSHSIEIPITVDTEAPALLEAYQITEADGSHSLVVVADDNVNTAAIFLMNPTGTQIYGVDYCFDAREDGSYLASFNVDGLGTELMICVGDYAGNEGYYNITYTAAGDNLPELDTNLLYAYRQYDYAIQYYMGADHMFGWTAMNKPDQDPYGYGVAWLDTLTDDYLEYAAINAAEYVDGKVFAVDAVHNLVVMAPGVWNRTTICNLGVNVLDMTFDDSTDTMYVLTKEDGYYVYLYALDLMTGEMTQVKYFGAYSKAPIAITDDDNGTLYAVKYQGASLYTMTAENDWAMTEVTDAEGNGIVLYDSTGAKTSPNYQQSMTFADGKIYWAYFTNSWRGENGEIFVINTEDFSYTSHSTVSYYDFADGYYTSVSELVGLLTLNETEYKLPEATALESITLSAESLVLTPGQSSTLSAAPTPWNYTLGELTWTSSDESVVTVVDGKVTAVAEGTAVITVTTESVSAQCAVVVVNTDTTFNAYNYYSEDGYYGYMIKVDTGMMDYYLTAESPVDWLAGEYNDHDGYFYGYTEGGQFWRYNPETGDIAKLGEPIGATPADMAYDYSTGKMYATMVQSSMWGGVTSILNVVDLNNGTMEEVFYLDGYAMMALACGPDGSVYTITADGMLIKLSYVYDEYWEEYSWMPEPLMMDLGYLQYMQSMCYDYANDVLIWAYCEGGSLVWIDPYERYAIALGDPTGAGLFEFVGMYTVPATLPELPDVAVDYAEVSDMLMLVDSVKYPNITIRPTNATCQNIDWTSSDSNVVAVTENGALKGISSGTATISGELVDTVSSQIYELEFTVTVLQGADDLYGHLMTDLATMGSQTWLRLYPTDPGSPDNLDYTDYVLYAEEYYDGKLYAFGYDPNDWSGAWQYFVMDGETHKILKQVSMDDSFPFVYDMTYDYTTSTMYCVAGAGSSDSDLYAVNLETGELILLVATDEFFMSLTASPDGTLYAMEQSLMDEYDGSVLSAQLYTIDPAAGTVERFADTGIQSNMLSSMTYDYDTGYIYWSALCQGSAYTGGLCLIDPVTGAATNLGPIGLAGAQVAGLYTICENFPAENEAALHGLILDTTKTVVTEGNTVTITANTLPVDLGCEIVWTSSDENVATVDNGVVTGIAQGKVVITATAAFNGTTLTAECEVAVLTADAAFLTWNKTDMGWSAISRADYGVVTNLTEGEELGVQTFTAVGNDVYGYDDNGNLFQLNTKTFERTLIGASVTETIIRNYMDANGATEEEYPLELFIGEVRDMAYDAVNDRMLVLTGVLLYEEWWEGYGEYGEVFNGNSIYSVDLTTGEITELFVFEEYSYVYGLTVDSIGTVYCYTTSNDYINKVDLVTGVSTLLVSLQTQSLYGEYGEGMHHAMHYDELTGMLYMQFTSNGKYYRMLTVDPATGALTAVDEEGSQIYIGEVVKQGYAYTGDLFTGMTFVELHKHSYGKVQFSWNFMDYTSSAYQICDDCGHQINHETTVTSEVFEATCTEGGKTVYTASCVVDGETYTTTIIKAGETATGHNYVDGACTNCGEADPDQPVYEADIVKATVSLDGTLNLNFYVELSEDLAAAENVSMQFTVNGKTENVALSGATIKGDHYVFTVKLAAKQMADEVGAQIFMGENAIGEAKSANIVKYVRYLMEAYENDENLVDLLKATLNYGAAAQVFFEYNTENLANADLDAADKVMPTVDASAYKHSIVGSEDGIKPASATLEIASENTIRIYFKLTGDKTIDEYNFTVNGEEVAPVLRNGMYCVEVPNIDAKGLDEMYAISVGGLTVNYSGLSYVNQVLASSSAPQTQKDVATALYIYNMAANEYFEAE